MQQVVITQFFSFFGGEGKEGGIEVSRAYDDMHI